MKDDSHVASAIRKNFYISIIFLIFLLLFNFVVWQVNKNHYISRANENFNEYSTDALLFINKQMDTYYSLLDFGAALFKSNSNVTRNEFDTFYQETIKKDNEKIGTINMVAFVQKVTNRQEFEKLVKSEQVQNFSFSIYPAGNRAQYWVINYVAPRTTTGSYFGYDILSEAEFRDAFVKAATYGETVITDRKVFINKEQILLIKPVYSTNLQVRTNDERLKALSGFVVIFLNPETLFINISEYFSDDFKVGMKLSIGHLLRDQVLEANPFFEDLRSNKTIISESKKHFEKLSYGTFGDKEVTLYTTAEISEQLGLFEGLITDTLFIVSNLITIVFFLLVADINSRTTEESQV